MFILSFWKCSSNIIGSFFNTLILETTSQLCQSLKTPLQFDLSKFYASEVSPLPLFPENNDRKLICWRETKDKAAPWPCQRGHCAFSFHFPAFTFKPDGLTLTHLLVWTPPPERSHTCLSSARPRTVKKLNRWRVWRSFGSLYSPLRTEPLE